MMDSTKNSIFYQQQLLSLPSSIRMEETDALATVNFRLHHVNYFTLHGVLDHATQAFKD